MRAVSVRMAGLRELGPEADRVYGGKAAGLSRLIAARARVPDGFAVGATTLGPDLWPAEMRAELIRRARPLLDQGPVAVRSSARGEDSALRSFAGLFDTVLGARTPDEVVAAATRCIASGGAARVLAYAGESAALPVGLVVQALVTARCGGVCFTIDPSGQDHALLIEAVAGTGEALVSGRVPPERWRVYRVASGGWEARREGPVEVLTAAEAARLAESASALAEEFGGALDLEWALDGAGLWWLQARPVTAATPVPERHVERFFEDVDDGPVTIWSNFNLRETMPEPFTPLNWTIWRDVVLPTIMDDLFGLRPSSAAAGQLTGIDLIDGRLYWNLNAMLATPWGRLFDRGLAAIDARAATTVARLQAEGILQPRRVQGRGAVAWLSLVASGLTGAGRLLSAVRPAHALRTLERCGREIAQRPAVATLGDAELLRELRLLASPEAAGLRRAQQMLGAGFIVYSFADRAFAPWPEAQRRLTAGLRGNPTTQISLAIDELVEAARPLAAIFAEPLGTRELLARLVDEAGGAAWLARLGDFLDRFGQRCPAEFDLGAARWIEDPTMILDLVRSGLAGPPVERVADRLDRLQEERARAVDQATAAAPAWRRPVLRILARLVERYMPLREAPKHHGMFVFLRMRQAALEAGARLFARGVLGTAEDVMFLELAEVERLLRGEAPPADLAERVGTRRARHQAQRGRKPPHFVRSDGLPVVEPAEAPRADGVLAGVGAAGGTALGRVRILREPDPRQLADGDVLVVEFADPGWTPLFPRARALVMEVGGLMCHAAVVARELGIPAVFGVTGATSRLADGQTVEVDGDRGTVTPVG